jgi:hypothetical protein
MNEVLPNPELLKVISIDQAYGVDMTDVTLVIFDESD